MSVAVVTGGSKGIGLAIVQRLAEEGWQVLSAGRDEHALCSSAAALRSKGLDVASARCDVTDEESVAALFQRCAQLYGWPDLLVNNAGVAGATVPTAELTRSEWDAVLAVNLTGRMLCARAALPRMVERRSGHIINISSITGKRPLRCRAAYAASKLGLIGFTRTLAEEMGADGVRVNAISPGVVAGDRIQRVIEGQAGARGVTVEEVHADFTAATPMRRFVNAIEVADAVIALHSLTAITGVDLNVAAGLVMY